MEADTSLLMPDHANLASCTPMKRNDVCVLVLVAFLTGFECLEREDPLRRDLRAVVLHYSQT